MTPFDHTDYGDMYKNLYLCVGPGWHGILARLSGALLALPGGDKIRVGQVKEKFGGLRFYLDAGHSPEANVLIDMAEEESIRTCEECGAPGERRPGSWILTLCDSCNEAPPKGEGGVGGERGRS